MINIKVKMKNYSRDRRWKITNPRPTFRKRQMEILSYQLKLNKNADN